jgi:serine/threonine-protein kinase RsbT
LETPINQLVIEITSEGEIITSRVSAQALAESIGFDRYDQTKIATAVSELTRNALKYAGSGRITLRAVYVGGRTGIEVLVEDQGPGFKNLDQALEGGHSTGGGLGLGVSGSRRLMDDFDIDTGPQGTSVVTRKWLHQGA